MLPVAFSGQARFICESGDHGGRPKFDKAYVAVLLHKQRIRGDPRKPVGSNKSNVFVIKIALRKIDRRNHVFGEARCDRMLVGISMLEVVR